MTTLRRLPALALTAVLLLPGAAVLAQDETTAPSGAPEASLAAPDARVAALEALVPPSLAGLPLGDNLQILTGEELTGVMSAEESAVLGDLLEANGKTVADYAAALTWIQVGETDIVVLQAHRIDGVDASQTIAAWVEMISLALEDAQVSEGSVGGRPVTLLSDAARPEVPLLYLFPAGDVVWMMVAADEALVEAVMDEVGADPGVEASPLVG